MRTRLQTLCLSVSALAVLLSTPALAQEPTPPSVETEIADQPSQLDEVMVTARKRSEAERVQDVPIAITAFGAQQIEDAHIVTLIDLGSRAPNVSLTNSGTFGGVANFTIRGLGINSSIPSIEPAVATFVDGVYLGTNFGVILDTFDLEGIEILRGPQGTLQGRNATGGAVMIRTRRPGNDFGVRMQAGVESGPQYTVAASVEGPIRQDVLSAKLAGYYKNDEGWFHNQFTDDNAGASETWFVRPMLSFTPTDDFDLTAIYERGRIRGDGVVGQNAADPTLTGFDLNYNEVGYTDIDWEALTVETNLAVGFGDGVITNIFGWRTALQDSLSDIDASAATFFHAYAYLDQRQLSNELRYAGTFGRVELTTGLFYFEQDYQYLERRILAGGLIDRTYGGRIDQTSWGVFAQGDIELTPTLTATLGLRYSTEEKAANIDRSPSGLGASNCVYATKSCPFTFLPKFIDTNSWEAWTPRVGLEWRAADDVLIYANWSQGVRSGGYNVRSTSTTVPPGPYDPENQDAFEIGFKSDLMDRRVRFNGAAFFNTLTDLQRDIILVATPPETGTVQVLRNAVDADVYGAELEFQFAATDNLRIEASAGYTGVQYSNVRFDLNNDGFITGADEDLQPPRFSPWIYSVGATYTWSLTNGDEVRAHADFGYRDPSFLNDANTVSVVRRNMLNADLSWSTAAGVDVSLYARNLLDEDWDNVKILVSTAAPQYTFRGMERGRVLGLMVKGRF